MLAEHLDRCDVVFHLALAGDPITVFGTGSQSRSFGYVGDIVQGMMALAAEPRAVGDVFTLGNNREITIRELAELVKTMTDSDSEIVTIPYEEAYESEFEDMPRRVPDLTKVKNLVGYEPRVELPEILTRVIEHHRAQRNDDG